MTWTEAGEFEATLLAQLNDSLPGSQAAVQGFEEGLWHQLTDEERRPLQRAVDKRRREYAAGRMAARRCAADLGLTLTELPVGPQREPCWPETLIGTISHDRHSAFAWLAPAGKAGGIGLDVECTQRLKPNTWRLLFSDSELTVLNQASDRELALTLFSAKESVYKCLFPRVRRFIGYKEVVVSPRSATELTVSVNPGLALETGVEELSVQVLRRQHRLATWTFIESGQRSEQQLP